MSMASAIKASAPTSSSSSAPLLDVVQTVLIVQTEALEHDDAIRTELKKKGFRLKQQCLVTMSKEEAMHFVQQICHRPSSDAPVSRPTTARTDEPTKATESPKATPRDTGAKPTPRPENESIDSIVAQLAAGPLLVIVVEKVNAIQELMELVGPATSDVWPAPAGSATTMRGRFGKSIDQVGVRCSQHASSTAEEIEFLLSCASGNRDPTRLALKKSTPSPDKVAQLRLDDLLDFLFPSHLQHPNSVGRLFVFGLYGPLDQKARLRSGEKGLHVVTDLELTTMSNRIEREDILSVYRMCSLSQEEEEEVMRNVEPRLKQLPRYTKRDIEALFAPLPRDADGCYSFHDMQVAILKERIRRVICMKDDLNPHLAPAVLNKFRMAMKRLTKTKDEIAPPSMFLKDMGLNGAENATLVSRLLSNHSFAICHLDDGNSPSLTQNVRMLRDEIRFPHDPRPLWNPSTAMVMRK